MDCTVLPYLRNNKKGTYMYYMWGYVPLLGDGTKGIMPFPASKYRILIIIITEGITINPVIIQSIPCLSFFTRIHVAETANGPIKVRAKNAVTAL
jgi:hypothetical protein